MFRPRASLGDPQIMALFDEYQSKENAKHVLRALKENARQGFWNGSLPPIGYRVVAAEQRGAKRQEEAGDRSAPGRRASGSGSTAVAMAATISARSRSGPRSQTARSASSARKAICTRR
jgi:hypothetical protein